MKDLDTPQFYKIGCSIGYILDTIESIRNPNYRLWFREVKQTGNRFLKAIEKVENKIVDEDENANQQLIDSYSLFNDLIELSLSINPKKFKSFLREMKVITKNIKN